MNKIFKILSLKIACLFIFCGVITAQIEGIEYDDVMYDENIHAVKFHLTGFPLTQPLIDLRSNATFTLAFDDMQEDLRDIYYTIIHCDADWQPSVLTTMEYLDGFDEEQFDQYGFSINTLTEFTTYQLTLPNERCLLYTSPSPRDRTRSRMPSSA